MPSVPDVPSRSDIAIRAVIAALPKLSESASIVYSGVRARQAHRLAITLQEITESTGEERLLSRLADDPEVEALFVEGVEAALATGLDAKRRLLARVVAQAINDDAQVDERALMVLALRDLEAPHLRALQRIRAVEDAAALEVSALMSPPDTASSAGRRSTHETGNRSPLPIRCHPPLITLQREALTGSDN